MAAPPKYLTGEELHQWKLCAALDRRNPYIGFLHFWKHHLKIEDKAKGGYVAAPMWEGQRIIARRIFTGLWLWILKARRLGITTIVLGYLLWLVKFRTHVDAAVMSQTMDTAEEILEMALGMERHLPEFLQMAPDSKSTSHVYWEDLDNKITVWPATDKACRSLTGNLLIFEEAAFMLYLEKALDAAQPILEGVTNATSIVLSTADGPADEFAAGYWDAKEEKSAYQAVFLDYLQRPGRSEAWREDQRRKNSRIRRYVERNYPKDDVECFEAAGGMVLSGFTRTRNIKHMDRPAHAECYRAMDFGTSVTSPCVCVWLWHDQLAKPGLTVEPDADIIETTHKGRRLADGTLQFFAYRRDPDTDQIVDQDNDVIDALRYVVTHNRMRGHVHIYRILSIRFDDEEKPANEWRFFRRIVELSGWRAIGADNRDQHIKQWVPDGTPERYAGTITDARGGFAIANFRNYGSDQVDTSCLKYRPPKGMKMTRQIEEGCAWLNGLIVGEEPVAMEMHEEPMDHREKLKRAGLEVADPATLDEVLRDQEIDDMLEAEGGGYLYGS